MTICRNKSLRSKQLQGKLKSIPLPPAVCLVIMDVVPSQKPAPPARGGTYLWVDGGVGVLWVVDADGGGQALHLLGQPHDGVELLVGLW